MACSRSTGCLPRGVAAGGVAWVPPAGRFSPGRRGLVETHGRTPCRLRLGERCKTDRDVIRTRFKEIEKRESKEMNPERGKACLKVFRYNPQIDEVPQYQTYFVPLTEEKINLLQ